MNKVELMVAAYIEAIYFTDTGDTDQPDTNAELTPLCKAKAFIDCRNFLWAIEGMPPYIDDGYQQMGHDLWLTRNGHGTGFWDRPEYYGEVQSDVFTRMAKAMGGHDAEFIECLDPDHAGCYDCQPMPSNPSIND
jgi:hypothetical protein